VPDALRTAVHATDSRATAVTADTPLWRAVRHLVVNAPTAADVQAHRLDGVAAACWTEAGRPVPIDLAEGVAIGRRMTLAAPLLLERARAACSGPLVLMKGPEVAAWYERPALRLYCDLDLLVSDARKVHRELVEAGFVPVGEYPYDEDHHLRPLRLPDFPLPIEIHARPRWIDGSRAPSVDEIVARAVPSATGVDGLLAPGLEDHVLLLAVHAWQHRPLGVLSQLVDVAAGRERAGAAALRSRAAAWRVSRLWDLTSRAVDALFYERAEPWPFLVWARNLPRGRERTMLELHLERWLAAFSVLPPGAAAIAACRAIADDVRPENGEGWGRKLRRTSLSLRNALRPQSLHDADVDARIGGRPRGGGA
jgi:hypothetical protein